MQPPTQSANDGQRCFGGQNSTSGGGAQADTGRGMRSPALVEADDFVLIHGNGLRPAGVEAAIVAIRAMPAWQAHPKPIAINEDSPAVPNLEAAW
jgi:hypothetical protein